MPKNLFLFGAGASFGSDTIGTPPLGSNLFEALVKFNPDGWGQIDKNLAKSFKSDFEFAVRSIHPHALPVLQRAMAAYFFIFVPGPNNLYKKIAKRLCNKEWDGAFISINYERLLELSLLSERMQPICGRDKNNANEVEICLPHGCCYLFCESVKGLAKSISFAGTNVQTNGTIVAITNPSDFYNRIKTEAFPPVMSYFEPSKRTTSGANFISAQRERLSQLISGASTIAIVGIKTRPHDIHLWAPLAQTQAEIFYCSGQEERESFLEWCNKNRSNKSNHPLNGYFSDYFEQLCQQLEIPK